MAIEIVTSAAVVLSLIYLAVEVRQNTRAIEGAAFQELIHASNESLLAVATDPELADIRTRGLIHFDSLTQAEQARYTSLVRVYWRNWENAFLQRNRGLLGDDEWAAYSALMCNGFTRYGATWDQHAPTLSPAFVAFIEAC